MAFAPASQTDCREAPRKTLGRVGLLKKGVNSTFKTIIIFGHSTFLLRFPPITASKNLGLSPTAIVVLSRVSLRQKTQGFRVYFYFLFFTGLFSVKFDTTF